jgi:hypothetical protein
MVSKPSKKQKSYASAIPKIVEMLWKSVAGSLNPRPGMDCRGLRRSFSDSGFVFVLRLPQPDTLHERERAWILAERAFHGKRKLRGIGRGSHNRFTGFPQGSKHAIGERKSGQHIYLDHY